MSDLQANQSEALPPEAEASLGVVQWSRQLPIWMRDALRRLYQHGTLTSEDDDELLSICATANGVELESAPNVDPIPLDREHVPDERQVENPVALLELRDLLHVNAVAPDQKLGFARSGLTIVYGDNGSGKSGYVRVLKRACRARHRERSLLSNVYTDPPTSPASAKIKYSINQQHRNYDWVDGTDSTSSELSRISVFDSRCAEIHVTGKNELAYTPRALAVLSDLAKAAQRLKAKLLHMEEQLQAERPPWMTTTPKPFRETTAVGNLMSWLSADTTIDSVDGLARLTSAEELRLNQLKTDLSEPPVRTVQRLRGTVQRLDSAINLVETAARALSDESVSTFRQHLEELTAKRDAARIAADNSAGDYPLLGVGSETWKTLWEAARKYSEAEAYADQPFPVTVENARCVLCQQELDSTACDRLTRFEAFVRNETQIQLEAATRSVGADRGTYREVKLTTLEIRAARDVVRTELDQRNLATKSRRYLMRALRILMTTLKAEAAADLETLRQLGVSPLGELRSVRDNLNTRIAELSSATNSESQRQLEAERDELEDRLWLRSSRPFVLREMLRLVKLWMIKSALDDTSTNRVTRRATRLAADVVTAKLRECFAREVDILGIGSLRAEMSQLGGSTGDSTFGITLIRSRSTNVADVFSEGEFRCIALAAFLAELATADDQSGIVFDDPVSSLDHNHRAAVARRLAQEALNRQVIVFTHDIVFLCELDEAAREQGIDPKYQCITRGSEAAGFATSEIPHNKQPPQSALSGIETHLDNTKRQYETGQQADWTRTAKSIAGQIRDCWELTAEYAFKPVMSRFSHKTVPSRFEAMSVFDTSDAASMREGYAQCSEWAHTSGPAAQAAPPTPAELQTEIERVKQWLEAIDLKQAGLRST